MAEATRILVLWYSRTGNTRRVGEALAAELGCESGEIVEQKNRSGVIGFIASVKDAVLKRASEIESPPEDPSVYDVVAVGTPVWVDTMSTPVRTYLTQRGGDIRRPAFFLTTCRSGGECTFRHMEEVCGKPPVATLALRTREIKQGRHLEKVKSFAAEITP